MRATPSGQRAAVDHRFVQGWRAGTSHLYPHSVKLRPVSRPGKLKPRSSQLYGLSVSTILLCVALWIRAKTIGEDERGNAERRALFVGLWPAMFWLIGDALRRSENRRDRSALAGLIRRP